jgi:hypothetical protein
LGALGASCSGTVPWRTPHGCGGDEHGVRPTFDWQEIGCQEFALRRRDEEDPRVAGHPKAHDRRSSGLVERLCVLVDGNGALDPAAGSLNSARTSNHHARSSAGRDKTTITGALPPSQ